MFRKAMSLGPEQQTVSVFCREMVPTNECNPGKMDCDSLLVKVITIGFSRFLYEMRNR